MVPWHAVLVLATIAFSAAAVRRLRVPALALLVGLGWGTASLAWQATHLMADASWLAHPWNIQARVARVETRRGFSVLWLDDVVRADGARLAGLARVFTHEQAGEGTRIAAQVRFRRCHPHANPGAWDTAAWCRSRGIALLGSVHGPLKRLTAARGLGRLRERLRAQMLHKAPIDARPWLLALTLGDRGLWTLEDLDRFAAAGMAHLLAISGLHVGMVGTAGAMAVGTFARLCPPLLARAPARTWGIVAGILGAWGYVALAGWPVSGMRAAIMFSVAGLAWALGRLGAGWRALALSFAAIALVSPAATESVGFWLSFAGTLALLLLPRAPGSRARKVGMLLWATLAAQAATLPWTLTNFGWLAPWSAPANLLASPVFAALLGCALAAVLAAMVGWQEAWHTAAHAVATLGDILAHIAGIAARLPGGMCVGHMPDLQAWAGALALAMLATWQALRGHVSRAFLLAIGAVAVVTGAALIEKRPREDALWVWDVGQGASSALLSRAGGVLLVDAPGRWGARITGGVTAARALHALGLLHADALVITHAQSDHGGGAPALVRRLNALGALWIADVPTRRRWFMRAAIAEARRKGARIMRIGRGDHLHLPGMDVDVLWPPHGAPLRRNEASLVLRVHAGGRTIILPGDAPARVERTIVPDLSPADIVLAPHHGSRTSSSVPFVRALRPRYVVVQAGRHNRWSFPHEEVVARWRAIGASIWSTQAGAVHLHLAPGPMRAVLFHVSADPKGSVMRRWGFP